MRNRIWRLGLCLAVTVTMLAATAVAGAAEAQEAQESKAAALLVDGIHDYMVKNYDAALQKFDQLLAMQPSSQDVLMMRKRADIAQLIEMRSDEKVGPAASRVLEMLTKLAREDKREIPEMDQLLTSMQSPDLKMYLNARATFIAHGQYSVPHLLPFLTLQGAKNPLVVGRTVGLLNDIGRGAAMPLLAALQTDDQVLKTRVVGVLGQIKEERAVPALLAIAQSPESPQSLVVAARDALRNITSRTPASLGAAIEQYQRLVKLYLHEDKAAVGYVFGKRQDVWKWDPDGKTLEAKLTYELVPTALYYQRQGAEMARAGLKLDPEDTELQSLLVCLQVRELQSARTYLALASADEVRDEVAKIAGALEARVPVVGRTYSAAVVGRALEHALQTRDSGMILHMVKLMGSKAGLETGEGGKALLAALEYPDKDVRYQAAIEIVRGSPRGTIGDPNRVMQVLSAALKRASAQTALLVFTDLQVRNKLRTALKEQGFETVECAPDPGAVGKALMIQPSVEILFVGGNEPQAVFQATYQALCDDARTATVPMLVVVDSRKPSADLKKADRAAVMSADDIRAEKLPKIVEQAMSKQPAKAGGGSEEQVLAAASALEMVDPVTTQYPVNMLEPSLIAALKAYGEPVQLAVVSALTRLGSAEAIGPLAAVTGNENASAGLRANAAYALAAIAQREGQGLPEPVVATLKKALQDPAQQVREAAGEALSVSGLGGKEILKLLDSLPQATAPVAARATPTAAGTPKTVAAAAAPGALNPFALATANTAAVVVIDMDALNKSGVLKQESLKGIADSSQLPIPLEQLRKVILFIEPNLQDPAQTKVTGLVLHSAPEDVVKKALEDDSTEKVAVEGLEAYAMAGQGFALPISKGAVLFANTPEALAAAVKTYKSGKVGMPEALGKTLIPYSKRIVNLAVIVPAGAKTLLSAASLSSSAVPAFVQDINALGAGVDVTGEKLDIGATVMFGKAENAKAACDLLTQQLTQAKAAIAEQIKAGGEDPAIESAKALKAVLDGITLSAKGADLVCGVKADVKQIEEMVGALMMRAMMQGVGGAPAEAAPVEAAPVEAAPPAE